MKKAYVLHLAGGDGERMKARFKDGGVYPKPLVPVCHGKFPMVMHNMALTKVAGLTDHIMITREGTEDTFNKAFGDGKAFGLNLSYVSQKRYEVKDKATGEVKLKPRGIPDAILTGIKKIEEIEGSLEDIGIIVLAGDNVYKKNPLGENELVKNMSAFLSENKTSCITFKLPYDLSNQLETFLQQTKDINPKDIKIPDHLREFIEVKDNKLKFKIGLSFKNMKDNKVTLQEKPTVIEFLNIMSNKDIVAEGLTAYYTFSSDLEELKKRVEELLHNEIQIKGNAEAFPPPLLQTYINDGSYHPCTFTISRDEWGDIGNPTALTLANFDNSDSIPLHIMDNLVNAPDCIKDEALKYIKNYRKMIRESTTILDLYSEGLPKDRVFKEPDHTSSDKTQINYELSDLFDPCKQHISGKPEALEKARDIMATVGITNEDRKEMLKQSGILKPGPAALVI